MATVRSRAQMPIGSAQWIMEEQVLANDFVAQEVEEFVFSARNEMEWLNEHMADVFNRNQFDVAEAFKTPGKLRGKTPRTARKRNQLEDRAPLTDVFAASNQKPVASPLRKNTFSKQTARFQVAEDLDDSHVANTVTSSRISMGTGKENTDSGYHDMTEDEMDVDPPIVNSQPTYSSPPKPQYLLSVLKETARSPSHRDAPAASREESVDTFVSAVEESNAQESGLGGSRDGEDATQPDEDVDETIAPSRSIIPEGHSSRPSNRYNVSASTPAAVDNALEPTEPGTAAQQDAEAEKFSPSSDGSSPERPLVRKKSSLTFASLPAREPLATKKSVGARTSHADQTRMNASSMGDHLARQTFGKPVTDPSMPNTLKSKTGPENTNDDRETDLDRNIDASIEVSEAAKQHSKTSTQRLQERLALLGKSNAPRPSKSIPSNAITSQMHPQPGTHNDANQAPSRRNSTREDNEESWIGPMKVQAQGLESQKPAIHDRPDLEVLSHDADAESKISKQSQAVNDVAESEAVHPVLRTIDAVASIEKFSNNGSISYPKLQGTTGSNHSTDVVRGDGPISASKAKLFSVLKSAKGIFASSASVSAQAKMEALSSAQEGSSLNAGHPSIVHAEDDGPNVSNRSEQDVHLDPMEIDMAQLKESVQRPDAAQQLLREPSGSSSGRPQDTEGRKGKPRAETKEETVAPHDNIEKSGRVAADQTKVNDPKDFEDQRKIATKATASEVNSNNHNDMPPPPPPKSQFSGTQMHKGELRRPNRPPKDAAPKTRPAPVSIRLASQRVGQMGPSSAVVGQSQTDPMPPAVPPKQPILLKKSSNSSLQTSSSSQSFKTTATSTSARPKALDAAARKKEQDEREAQRKAQQKQEIERRRAAKAEEERRAAQEQKAAEQRAQEAKQQAQKQASEQRKADALQRAEQQRNQAASARNKPSEEFVSTVDNERSQAPQNIIRSEASTIRTVSKIGHNQEPSRPAAPHMNPAKPPKRQFNAEDDYSQKPLPGRPAQNDHEVKKRRRTSQDSFVEVVSRPTMAPPVRPSMMRKENMNKFTPGFMSHANLPNSSSSMLKNTVNNQHQLQHPKTPHMNDLAKYSTARIPFAEAPNPPQTGPFSSQQQQHQQRLQQPLKTPNSVPHKPSPQYPNGDSIDLPEIATDSEDSDDDDFVPPDWANSPALRELLKEQQLVDPMKVFGPIAPLMMEEVFKGNKDRQAKFRNRTSSANWNGPDKLTEEERRRDREARERLEREGAWTFGGPAQ